MTTALVSRLRWLGVTAFAALALVVIIAADAVQAVAEGFLIDHENHMTALVNGHRAEHGLRPLGQDPALQMVARRQAQRMVAAGYIYHNPNLAAEAGQAVPNWLLLGENVGVGPSVEAVEQAFLNSARHHENIDKGQYVLIGLGAMANEGSTFYFTQNFANVRSAPPPGPGTPARAASGGRRAPRPPRAAPARAARRAPRRPAVARGARRAKVRGVEIARADGAPAGTSWSGESGTSLPRALAGMLGHASGKAVFWD